MGRRRRDLVTRSSVMPPPSVDFQDNSYDVDVEWMQHPAPGTSRGFGGLRGRRRGSRGSPRRMRRRRGGGLMAGDVEHMVVDADWAPHGAYGHQDHGEDYGHVLHDMQGDEGEYDPGSSPSGMFVRKRERTQNWSLQEKLLLFRLVAPRLDILENRRIDAMSSARKGRAWREIHELFSARYGPERDVFRIREQWRRMKQAAKADVAGKNPQKPNQSPAAAAVAAAVAAATGQVHIGPSSALAQSLMMPPTAANLAAQHQQQAVIQQQHAAVAAAAVAANATTRNQMNSVLSDMIVKALEKAREREQEGGGPFDLSELDEGMGLGGFFSSGATGMTGLGNQQGIGNSGNQNNSQLDNSHGSMSCTQGALSGQTDNNPSGSATSSGGSNDAWRLTIVPSTSSNQQANNRLSGHQSEGGYHAANNQGSEGNGTKVNVKKEEAGDDDDENGDDEDEGEEDDEEEGDWQEGEGGDDQSSRQGRSDGQEGGNEEDEGEDGDEEECGGGDEEGDDGMEMVEPDVEMEEGKGTFMIMEMRRREHQRRMQIMEREHELRCEVLQVEREAAIIRRETAISERERGWKTVDDFLRCVGAWPKENKEKKESSE